MKTLKEQYGKGFLVSAGMHLVLLLLLVFSLFTSVNNKPSGSIKPNGEIIQATVVDQKEIDTMTKRIEQKAEHQKKLEQKKQAEILQKAEQLKKVKLQEEKKVAEMKQQEENRLAAIKIAKEKEKETQKLEALQKEKEKQKEIKQLKAQEERKQEEIARAKEMKQQQEQIEKQSSQDLAKEKSEQTARLAAKEAREAAESAERSQWMASEKDKFDALLIEKINHSWIRPPGLSSGLVCELEAHLLPDGSIVDPRIRSSSGNIAFDQAALAALQKASPLPVPNDPGLMDLFRHFNFRFVPPEET